MYYLRMLKSIKESVYSVISNVGLWKMCWILTPKTTKLKLGTHVALFVMISLLLLLF